MRVSSTNTIRREETLVVILIDKILLRSASYSTMIPSYSTLLMEVLSAALY